MMALAMSQDIILRHVLFMHATLFSRSRGLADQGYYVQYIMILSTASCSPRTYRVHTDCTEYSQSVQSVSQSVSRSM